MKTVITNKTIWNIAYPIILGSLAQTLITLTDTAFLGRVSEVALGASAMAGIYYYVFSTLAWGFSIGIQIIVARRLGEGKLNRIGVVFEHGLCFVFLLSMTLFLIQRYYSDVLLGASIQSPISMRQPWNTCPTVITGLYSCVSISCSGHFTSDFPTQKSSVIRRQPWQLSTWFSITCSFLGNSDSRNSESVVQPWHPFWLRFPPALFLSSIPC